MLWLNGKQEACAKVDPLQGNESIYLHRSGAVLENGLDKPDNRYGRYVSVAMPADSRREKIFDFVREFAVKYFRIVPVRDSTQQNKA